MTYVEVQLKEPLLDTDITILVVRANEVRYKDSYVYIETHDRIYVIPYWNVIATIQMKNRP